MTRVKIPQKPKKNEGQILVLMALLSTTLVILFGMVVAMGHLIQAKINLQNAVDLASMAGASQQARFMNHLSLVNYRLRQNYKFQLYDFYITASRFNAGLRASVNAGGNNILERINKNETAFGICQQSFGFEGRFGDAIVGQSTGTPTAVDTDFCRNVQGSGGAGLTIPPIVPSPVPNLNPVLIAANLAIINLSRQLVALCQGNSGTNRQYFQIMTNTLDRRQRFQVREMIKIIDEFDRAFGTGDTLDTGRTADATMMRTLRDNLIGANKTGNMEVRWLTPNDSRAFRVGSITQLETRIFNPTGSAGAEFEKYFERQRVNFTFPYVDFGDRCNVSVQTATSTLATIIGIARSRRNGTGPVKIPITSAIQVTVTPNLLFWPTSLTPTLVAVGGAKSFGSRIGPPLELTNFEVSGLTGQRNEQSVLILQGNMSFYPGDTAPGTSVTGPLPGIGHKRILRYLFNALSRPGNGPGSGTVFQRPSALGFGRPGNCTSQPGQQLPFLCLALAPTLYEGFFFNAYQFPPGRIDSALIRAAFPSDLRILVAPEDFANYRVRYGYPDRDNPANANRQTVVGWHATPYIGGNADFRLAGKPVFFADTISSQSSWSPDYTLPLNDLNPSEGEQGRTHPASRQGYAIKLVTMREICDLFVEGGNVVQPTQLLRDYCTVGGVRQLFH